MTVEWCFFRNFATNYEIQCKHTGRIRPFGGQAVTAIAGVPVRKCSAEPYENQGDSAGTGH